MKNDLTDGGVMQQRGAAIGHRLNFEIMVWIQPKSMDQAQVYCT